MNPTGTNPYVVVGSPNYAAPLVNFTGQQQGQGQQGKSSYQLGQQYAAALKNLLGGTGAGGGQPGAPMNINPGNPGAIQQGNIGGTSLFGSPIY